MRGHQGTDNPLSKPTPGPAGPWISECSPPLLRSSLHFRGVTPPHLCSQARPCIGACNSAPCTPGRGHVNPGAPSPTKVAQPEGPPKRTSVLWLKQQRVPLATGLPAPRAVGQGPPTVLSSRGKQVSCVNSRGRHVCPVLPGAAWQGGEACPPRQAVNRLPL